MQLTSYQLIVRPFFIVLSMLGSLALNACVVRTVTDENGHQIYKKPVAHTPWESEQQRLEEVEKTEHELGVY